MPLAPEISIDQLVLAEKARALQTDSHMRVGGYVICCFSAGGFLYDEQRSLAIWLWLGAVVLISVLNVIEEVWVKRHPRRLANAEGRLRDATRSSLIFGVIWAVGVMILWPGQAVERQGFLLVLTAGMSAASQISITVHLPAFYAFNLPCNLSLIFVAVREGGLPSYMMAIAATTYLVVSIHFIGTLNKTFVAAIRSRFEMADLAKRLHQQKEVAEEASRSKSRFLAAASHDLRQPVHSMSLFVGALAQQPQTAEGDRLVTHLQATVESLGTMFNALLNISKLDANIIQPDWAVIDLQCLLQNVCDAEAVVARDKGLALRLNAPPLWIRSDPVLIDRVMRNLLTNAVRYTDRGTVVVSARLRAGEVLVRVADTGIGIAADHQENVFNEFVQLHNSERDRNNGLGLGLAIVKRLTALLQIRLRLLSRPNRGTVFSLWLGAPTASGAVLGPRAQALPASVGDPAELAIRQLPHGALVFVIDDDADIRNGATALLKGWGYDVMDFSGLAETVPFTATCSKVPKLIICDLRLRNGENGIETVEALRTQYNDELPAILITGDTDPERLRLAQQSGLALLHKPVAPQNLKATMLEVMVKHAEEGKVKSSL